MKAILVIDMPKNCGDCKLFMNNGNSYWCAITGYDTTSSSMPNNCPLKPLPNKIDQGYPCEKYDEGYSDGWDECIDEILGDQK